MSTPRIIVLFILAGLLCFSAGCSTTRAPKLDVIGMRAVAASDEAVQINIDVRLTNQNAEPLEIVHVDYSFAVDGHRVFRAHRATRTTLGSNASHTITIPAVITDAEARWSAAERPMSITGTVSGEFVYVSQTTLAEMLLDSGVRQPSVGFRGSDDIPFSASRSVTADTIAPLVTMGATVEIEPMGETPAR
jgi:hypothetical protein